MDYEKAQQIIKSPDTVKVLYKGRSIWIEGLNPANETASISSDSGTEIVSVQDLIEG